MIPEPAERDVLIPAAGALLPGDLVLPAGAVGLVLFAHGSGSGRRSPRNRFVAGVLAEAGLATLLFDLLTPDEERDRANVFDVDLLGLRLAAATGWARACDALRSLPIGYFGASTGAAAALVASVRVDPPVGAVVSRGGRPDLAERILPEVTAPTLLVVGGCDEVVLDLNRAAAARLACDHEVVVVPGATHLFEEPGALDDVARLARAWFLRHLDRSGP